MIYLDPGYAPFLPAADETTDEFGSNLKDVAQAEGATLVFDSAKEEFNIAALLDAVKPVAGVRSVCVL